MLILEAPASGTQYKSYNTYSKRLRRASSAQLAFLNGARVMEAPDNMLIAQKQIGPVRPAQPVHDRYILRIHPLP